MKNKKGNPLTNNLQVSFFHHKRKFLKMFLVINCVFMITLTLGCVLSIPRPFRQEEPTSTLQPSPTEMATNTLTATATITPSPYPPTETPETECSRLNLSVQECVSLGEHMFTITGVVDGYCWYGTDDRTVTRDLLINVSFSNEGSEKKVLITDGIFMDCPATLTSPNTYNYDCINQSNRDTGTITFLDNGFLNEGGMTNSVNKNCTWSQSYEIIQ